MERCRAGLEHPERYLREDCARALLLDGLEHEGFPALPGLLGHADPVVRAAAAATLHEVWLADPASFPLGRLVPTLTGLLADTERRCAPRLPTWCASTTPGGATRPPSRPSSPAPTRS